MRKFLFVGGTSGLGELTSTYFRSQNYNVLNLGRKKLNIQNNHFLDLFDTKNLEKNIKEILDTHGKITGACFFQRNREENINTEDELRVSVYATEIILNIIPKYLDDNKDHPIVLVSSVNSSFITKKSSLGYHISKAAFDIMVKYYASIYSKYRMRFNTVNPGTFVKPCSEKFYENKLEDFKKINPMKEMLKAEEISKTIFFLSSEDSNSINGQNIILDKGTSVQWIEGAIT